jgi:ESAT-6 family protein
MTVPGYSADGVITYDFASIMDVADAIGTFQGGMDGALQDLYNQFRQMFGTSWAGAAQEACDAAQKQWRLGADEVRTALFGVGQALGASAQQMQQVDTSIASQM